MQENEVKSAIRILQNERNQLQNQIVSIDQVIANLESKFGNIKPSTPTHQEEKDFPIYDKNWPYSKKILYILKEKQRFLHFREIAEEIVRIEGITNPDISKLAGKLSSSSFSIKKSKAIEKVTLDKMNRKTFWGSPKWFDEKGNVKPEHMYNQELAKSEKNEENIEL